jgi:YebC/PmpR family DNA-binding regulatory protein
MRSLSDATGLQLQPPDGPDGQAEGAEKGAAIVVGSATFEGRSEKRMSGHSHWATIRRKKDAKDSKRGKLFSKLARVITLAARSGGDPETNFKLRVAIDAARSGGLPRDNIERAVRRGSGEEAGEQLEEIVYEGLGPEGIHVIVEALTDNRNRTTAELRKLFERKGGKMGTPNSVAWNFDSKGHISLPTSSISEEALFDLIVDAGAETIEESGKGAESLHEVYCAPEKLEALRKILVGRGLELTACELTRVAKSSVRIESEAAVSRVLGFVTELEDHDDVQNVSSNCDIAEDLLAKHG